MSIRRLISKILPTPNLWLVLYNSGQLCNAQIMLGHPIAGIPNIQENHFQCEQDLMVLFLHHAHQ